VQVGDVAHVPQPVVDQPVLRALERRQHAAAAVVAADDDVPHLQHVDGVLQDGQAVEVGVHHDVGDVAMHEHLPGQPAHDLVRRHAAVGAADPEEFRGLLVDECLEEMGIPGRHAGRPARIVREQLGQTPHVCRQPSLHPSPMHLLRTPKARHLRPSSPGAPRHTMRYACVAPGCGWPDLPRLGRSRDGAR
jgi:hypothetical protein